VFEERGAFFRGVAVFSGEIYGVDTSEVEAMGEPQGELPVTGMPVWILLLIGGGLLAGGLVLLRRGRSEP
jgi:LPXTG-motif cell wall-anchored protein